ncbi:hypothetical protein CBW65_15405 [Tumebacillus avium]|uniref:Thioredoxin domain-containing protein n=1 Tax=Tumebacillus avium TaxID=1903704 RepID=A0A1Y0INV6_9BACL|nr:redoxin domain-containing protein [Tumebacillus avium]ARU62238.1 hypothetical protein CBW65_15405 [Tumebacillus avium]
MEKALMLSTYGLGIAAIVQFVLYFVLAKQIGGFLQNVRKAAPTAEKRGLAVGSQAPGFRELDHLGREVSLQAGQATMLLFTLPHCEVCKEITPHLAEARERIPNARWIVITSDEGDAEKAALLPPDISLIASGEVRQAYAVKYVPALVMISENRQVIVKVRVNSFEDMIKRLEMHGPQIKSR